MDRRRYCGFVVATALAGCTDFSGQSADTTTGTETQDSGNGIGTRYTTEAGATVTLDRVEPVFERSVVLGDDTPFASETAGFALLRLVAENTGTDSVQSPAPGRFRLLDGEERRNTYQEDFADDPRADLESTISEPVSGPLFPAAETLAPEERTAGWLVFAVSGEGNATLEFGDSNGTVLTTWEFTIER